MESKSNEGGGHSVPGSPVFSKAILRLKAWRTENWKSETLTADDDAVRGFLRIMPAGMRIYMAMSLWTLLAWPMAMAHLYVNLGLSPNMGNLAGLSFGGLIEGVLLVSSRDMDQAWIAERRYRDFCIMILWVNVGVVFIRTIIQHWH